MYHFSTLICILLMKSACPNQNLIKTSQIEDIMNTFWIDIEHGTEAMHANAEFLKNLKIIMKSKKKTRYDVVK